MSFTDVVLEHVKSEFVFAVSLVSRYEQAGRGGMWDVRKDTIDLVCDFLEISIVGFGRLTPGQANALNTTARGGRRSGGEKLKGEEDIGDGQHR